MGCLYLLKKPWVAYFLIKKKKKKKKKKKQQKTWVCLFDLILITTFGLDCYCKWYKASEKLPLTHDGAAFLLLKWRQYIY